MKNLRLLQIISIIIFLGVSCSKKDNAEKSNSGILTIGETDYSLVHGELLRIDEVVSGEVYYGYIYLLSNGYHYGSTTISGIGEVIELSIFFNNPNEITSGNYTLSYNEPYQSGTFIVNFFTDFNMSTFGVSALYKPTSGTLTVTKSGNIYELSLSVLADKYIIAHADDEPTDDPVTQNVTVTCTYSGDLKQKYLSK